MPQHQVDHPRVVRQSYQTSRRFDRSIPGAQSAPGIGRPVCKDVRSEESSDLAVRQCCGTCGERSAGVRPPLLRHGGQGVGHVRRQSIGGRVPLSHSGDRRHIKRALHEVAKRNRAGAPCPQVFDGERETRKSSPRVVINQPHRERLSQPPRVHSSRHRGWRSGGRLAVASRPAYSSWAGNAVVRSTIPTGPPAVLSKARAVGQ